MAYRRLLFAAAMLLAMATHAMAQSNPNWTLGFVPSPAQWNAEWGTKVDTSGGTLTGGTIAGGTFSGTIAGTPTFSGSVSLTSPTIAGGAMSGTITGSPTFSGTPVFSGLAASSFNVTATGSSTSQNLANKFQGILSTAGYPNLTYGAGQTTLVRQANCTALNAAIAEAEANNEIFKPGPGIIEISCSGGILIPATAGFKWDGSKEFIIEQFYNTGTGAPILTIGDTTGASVSSEIEFSGVQLDYGADETGKTAAQAIVFGAITRSVINNVAINPRGIAANPYDGMYVNQSANFYSNTMNDWTIWSWQHTALNLAAMSTGNVFGGNWYLNDFSNTMTGNYIAIGIAGENNFNGEFNLENGTANQVVSIQNNGGVRFASLHIENVSLTGSNAMVFALSQATVNFGTLSLINLGVPAGLATQAYVFSDVPASGIGIFFGPSNVTVDQFIFTHYTSALLAKALVVYGSNWGTQWPGVGHGTCTIFKSKIFDQTSGGNNYGTFFNFDVFTPVSSTAFFVPNTTSGYEFGISGSAIYGAIIPVSSTYTHYGEYVDATLTVPTSVTSFNITLAATQAASGTQLVSAGNRVHVTREAGTFSGTVLVKDDAGTTIGTFSNGGTTPTDLDFIFNGTHYVAFTPITESALHP